MFHCVGGMKNRKLDPLLTFPYKKKGRRTKRWFRRMSARLRCQTPKEEDYDTESEDEMVSVCILCFPFNNIGILFQKPFTFMSIDLSYNAIIK